MTVLLPLSGLVMSIEVLDRKDFNESFVFWVKKGKLVCIYENG